jgi:hypothetical protein
MSEIRGDVLEFTTHQSAFLVHRFEDGHAERFETDFINVRPSIVSGQVVHWEIRAEADHEWPADPSELLFVRAGVPFELPEGGQVKVNVVDIFPTFHRGIATGERWGHALVELSAPSINTAVTVFLLNGSEGLIRHLNAEVADFLFG